MAGRLFDGVVELVDAPAALGSFGLPPCRRSAVPFPGLRHRGPCSLTSHAARPTATGLGPDGDGTRRPWRRGQRRCPRCAWRNGDQVAGEPAISACPWTIGRHSSPKRWISSARNADWYKPPSIRWCRFKYRASKAYQRPSRGLNLRRDDCVGVDLRVVGPRGRLTERRDGEAVGIGMQTAAAGEDGVVDPNRSDAERRRDGDVVGFKEPVVAGQGPPHPQRLRRRERRVEPDTALTARPSAVNRSSSSRPAVSQ